MSDGVRRSVFPNPVEICISKEDSVADIWGERNPITPPNKGISNGVINGAV